MGMFKDDKADESGALKAVQTSGAIYPFYKRRDIIAVSFPAGIQQRSIRLIPASILRCLCWRRTATCLEELFQRTPPRQGLANCLFHLEVYAALPIKAVKIILGLHLGLFPLRTSRHGQVLKHA